MWMIERPSSVCHSFLSMLLAMVFQYSLKLGTCTIFPVHLHVYLVFFVYSFSVLCEFGHWVCGENWHCERSLPHYPSSQVSCSFVCCVCDFDVCIWVCVWGGVSETSFLLFLHLSFLLVCYARVSVHIYMYVVVHVC